MSGLYGVVERVAPAEKTAESMMLEGGLTAGFMLVLSVIIFIRADKIARWLMADNKSDSPPTALKVTFPASLAFALMTGFCSILFLPDFTETIAALHTDLTDSGRWTIQDQIADEIPPEPAWRVWLNYSGGLAAFPLSVLSLLFSRRIGRWWDGREKAAD